jgi:hypothetical protein
MQHDEQIVFERENDAFAESANIAHPLSLHGRDRWIHTAKKKGTPQPDVLEGRTTDSAVQCFDIDSDVRKLWHIRRDVRAQPLDVVSRAAYGGKGAS